MGIIRTSSLSLKLSKIIVYIGAKVYGLAKRIANFIYKRKATLKDFGWVEFCKSGGESLRFNYPLNKESVVFDLGGYDGQFSSDLFSKYESTFYIFEAYKPFAEQITERFKLNNKIKVYDFGLAAVDEIAKMSIDSVGSSAFIESDHMVDISLKNCETFINTNQINHIDLFKINIEGGEYGLLNHLIDNKIIDKIENLQVQFHDFVPNAYEKMIEIRNKLLLTHYPTYQFDFIWENWKRK